MNSRENKRGKRTTALLAATILLNVLLGGCAGKQWTKQLEEEETAEIVKGIHLMQEECRASAHSFDATALIFWKSPLEESALQGYLQLLSPSFVKFVINNPLGQPLYAISSNGNTFQSLDIAQQQHIRGNIRSLALRNDIPPGLMGDNWFAYLTGRLPERPMEIEEIYQDASSQTVWVLLPTPTPSNEGEKVYAHLSPTKREVLEYLLVDRQGKTLANISYEEQGERNDPCAPRETIEISELPWGAEFRLELKDIRSDRRFEKDDFSLPVPPGYATQLQP